MAQCNDPIGSVDGQVIGISAISSNLTESNGMNPCDQTSLSERMN